MVFTYFAFAFESSLTNQIIIITTAFIFGFLFHIIMFFYLRKKGKLADDDASIREERGNPYLVATLFYFLGWLILLITNVNPVSVAFGFSYILNTLFIFLINRKWKISAHAVGAAGPLAAMVIALGPTGFWFFLLLPLIGWARIKLKVHNLGQVIAGALLGFISTYLQMYLLINYFLNNAR